jgi:membrane protein YqaA with SNARE-associated domain
MTGFYTFLTQVTIKTGLILGFIVLMYLAFDYFLLDTETLFHNLTSNYSPLTIFSVFFTSEIFMGLIPPEFFIAWTTKTINPWLHVFLLGTLSYAVGILTYYIGQMLFLLSSVKRYLETKVSKHIHNLKRWGGLFIIIGALLPFPYAMVSLTSGLINFRIKHYMLWALFRYVRFFIYAVVIFKIM